MEGEPNTWLILLDQAIIPLLVLILTPVLTALANRMIAAVQEKTKVELSQQQKEALHAMVEESLHYAEEQAHKSLAAKTGKLSGDTKMEHAIAYIQTKSKVLALDDLAAAKSEELGALIEAQLFTRRLDEEAPTIAKPAQLESDATE